MLSRRTPLEACRSFIVIIFIRHILVGKYLTKQKQERSHTSYGVGLLTASGTIYKLPKSITQKRYNPPPPKKNSSSTPWLVLSHTGHNDSDRTKNYPLHCSVLILGYPKRPNFFLLFGKGKRDPSRKNSTFDFDTIKV